MGPARVVVGEGKVSLIQDLRAKRHEIEAVAARHGAGNVEVFGSVARREETDRSDIDLLVDIVAEPGPWFPGGLAADLEDLLGRRVQIIIRRSLSPLIREAVLKEAAPL